MKNFNFEKKKKIAGVISMIVFVLFMLLSCWFIGKPMLELVSEPEIFRDWIAEKGLLGKLIFVGMVILQVIFAIIPGEPLEIGAGYAFGMIEGTILCLVGFLIGSIVIFLFVKKWGVKFVELFFSVDKINNLRFLNSSKKVNFLAYILFLIPGTPKDLLVYFLGLTNIKPFGFFMTVTIARIPSLVTSTVAGDALGEQKYIFAVVVFSITLIISLLGYIIYNLFSKHYSKKP